LNKKLIGKKVWRFWSELLKKIFPYLDIYRLIDLSACSQIEICFWPFW
jgi:hypothetical protein